MFCTTGEEIQPLYPNPRRLSRNDEHNLVVWLNEGEQDGTVSKPCGLFIFWSVDRPEGKKCEKCALLVEDIVSTDVWYSQCGEFYCGVCYEKEKAILLERVYRHNDKLREMPRLLTDVKKQIIEHRRFGRSESLTTRYNLIVAKESKKLSAKDSKFLRELWLNFFHQKPRPK